MLKLLKKKTAPSLNYKEYSRLPKEERSDMLKDIIYDTQMNSKMPIKYFALRKINILLFFCIVLISYYAYDNATIFDFINKAMIAFIALIYLLFKMVKYKKEDILRD